jgi:hypothetical protein
MDPALTAAGLGPWAQLGIVGSVVVALSGTVVLLWRALSQTRVEHMADVRSAHSQTLDITIRKIESDNNLARALEGVEKVVAAALDALKKGP